MVSIFEHLVEKLSNILIDLNFGLTISECQMSDLLGLMHILHYSSYVNDDPIVNKIFEYYA